MLRRRSDRYPLFPVHHRDRIRKTCNGCLLDCWRRRIQRGAILIRYPCFRRYRDYQYCGLDDLLKDQRKDRRTQKFGLQRIKHILLKQKRGSRLFFYFTVIDSNTKSTSPSVSAVSDTVMVQVLSPLWTTNCVILKLMPDISAVKPIFTILTPFAFST